MDNKELKEMFEKLENEISNKFAEMFKLLREHNNEVNNVKIKQAELNQRLIVLEGKTSNTRANISIAIAIIMFLGWLITTIIQSGVIK